MLWEFSDSSWEQDDNSKTYRIKNIFGQNCESAPIVPLDILLGAKNHPPSGEQCGRNVFPSQFMHCPYCGSKLLGFDEVAADIWLPPYGSGTGLKLLSMKPALNKKLRASAERGSQFLLPSRDGYFSFCSVRLGAQQRLLIAVQRNNGQLWIYRPTETKKWEALIGAVGGDSLPSWSWSMTADSSESGLCLPTDQGPVWATVDWASGSIIVDRAEGRSVGGAVRIGNYLLAPVLRGNSFVIVCRKEGESNWSECSATSDPSILSKQLQRNSSQDACLGIPVVDESKQIVYWPCRGGYVRVFGLDSPGGLIWEFRPWETDEHPATALIELGPPYRKTGSRPGFWQLCEDRDISVRDGIINKIIKIDGDEKIDSEDVECGQFVTTGRASFSWSDDYWDDIHKRNPRMSEQVELRFPLIQFGEKGFALIAKVVPWEGRDELGVFSDLFFNKCLKTTAFVRFVIENDGIPEKALFVDGADGVHSGANGSLFRVGLAHLPETSTFIYGNSIYIYLPEKNECYCWPLEIMEG